MAAGGLKLLYNLLLKDAVKGSGEASGIMSIGDSVRALAQKRFQSYVMSAQKQGVDLDKFNEGQLKYMLEMNKAGNKVKMKQTPSIKKDNVIEAKFGKSFGEEVEDMNLMEAIEDASPGFANDIKVDAELVAENLAARMGKVYDDLPTKERLDFYDKAYTGLSKQRFKNMRKPYDDDLPEDMADGGRIGFKMGRRAFLGLMGAGAAGIGAAKTGLLKLLGKGKATAKIAEVTTPSVAGKPSWFDALANRVISEGENVTKRFATKEREIVHVKALDDETTVYVYRDLDDGSVRIDIDDPFRNVQGDQGDALVSLEYKPGIADEGTKGKPPDTFQAVENDYANYMDGPDDYVTEVTDNTVTDTKNLTADLTKVKLYAKGQKKPTLKEFVESRKRKEALKQAEENPSQYAADRYTGPDPEDYVDDMASGGLAGLLGE